MSGALRAALFSVGFILVFLVYYSSMAPDVVFDPSSSGTLLASVASPEFYSLCSSPLYCLLGQLWKLLPWGTLAFRGNLIAVVTATLCAGAVFLIVNTLVKNSLFALLGSVLVAFSPLSFGLGLYANSQILLLLLILLFLALAISDEIGERLPLALLIVGLSVAVSSAAAFLAIPLGVYCWGFRRRRTWRAAALGLAAFLAGLCPVFVARLVFGISLSQLGLSLQPLAPLWSAWSSNFGSFAEGFLILPWPLFPLGVIGLVWGISTRIRKLFLGVLISQLLFLGIYPVGDAYGVPSVFAALLITLSVVGAKVLWDLLFALSDVELGTAFDTRAFVLVFRLRREGFLARYLFLGSLSLLLGFLAISEFRQSSLITNHWQGTLASDYLSAAKENIPSGSLLLSQNDRYLSVLRYLSATLPDKDLMVVGTDFFLDDRETARLREFHSNILLPAGNPERLSEETLHGFTADNYGRFPIYLTLDYPSRGIGSSSGYWGEYLLVSEEPLYRLLRR